MNPFNSRFRLIRPGADVLLALWVRAQVLVSWHLDTIQLDQTNTPRESHVFDRLALPSSMGVVDGF